MLLFKKPFSLHTGSRVAAAAVVEQHALELTCAALPLPGLSCPALLCCAGTGQQTPPIIIIIIILLGPLLTQ
jgi:hypothetical protein